MTHPSSGTHGLTAVLLSIHVLAAIVLIGPITVAASLFPRYARAELSALAGSVDPSGSSGAAGPTRVAEVAEVAEASGVAGAMHRITSGYAVAAIVVPVFGIGTALRLHVLGQYWLWISLVLTAVAALLLAGRIVPLQARLLAILEDTRQRSSKLVDVAEPEGPYEMNDVAEPAAPYGRNPAAEPSAQPYRLSPPRARLHDHDRRDGAEPGVLLARLGMLTGIFGLLWAAVVVLMIFRPGSTTGAGA